MTDTDRANTIISVCCECYGTTIEEVKYPLPRDPRSDVQRCWMVIADLINMKTGLTHKESALLVNRKGATVTGRIKKIGGILRMSPAMRDELDKLKLRLTELGV